MTREQMIDAFAKNRASSLENWAAVQGGRDLDMTETPPQMFSEQMVTAAFKRCGLTIRQQAGIHVLVRSAIKEGHALADEIIRKEYGRLWRDAQRKSVA